MMKNKKILGIVVVAVIIIIVAVIAVAAGLGGKDKKDPTDATSKAKATTERETVGTDVDGRKIDDQSFCGKWIADSDKAKNMFDGFEIVFNEDNTYTAVVTQENLSGTWKREGETVILSDIEEILDCDFTYTQKGGLQLTYEGEHVAFHR